MRNRKFSSLFAVTCLFVLIAWLAVVPQVSACPKDYRHITTYKEVYGHDIGEDYYMANYTQMVAYWKKLDRESNRMKLIQYGMTSGLPQPFQSPPYERPMYAAIISSPDNLARLDHYKRIAKRLALAEGLTEDEAKDLASEGKAIIYIGSSMHASEWVNNQAMIQFVYKMVSSNDEETLRILDDVIIVATCENPDGMDLYTNWYMNDHITGLPQTDPLKRSSSSVPTLYQKYVAHDNNRDFYTYYQREAQALGRLYFSEFFPQIIYCQHQSGPSGEVLFIGAVRDPMNYNLDTGVISGLENMSSYFYQRYARENLPGAGCRTQGSYSAWHNGMVRTVAYFHNAIGILSEITGGPTPTRISFSPTKLVARADYPYPIPPQDVWHLSQCLQYIVTADTAMADYASRNRDTLLFEAWKRGNRSIQKGSQDNWTWYGVLIDKFMQLPSSERTYPNLLATTPKDAYGYIIPSDQADFQTAIKLCNQLLRGGVAVQRATQDFVVAGKAYPKGSLVVKAGQAYRPCVMDAFEPLWHPMDIAYPGASPTPPYDVAGYTMAFQTGIEFDRISEAFDGPFEKITLHHWDGAKWLDEIKPPAGIAINTGAVGYLLSHEINDSFVAVNRLMQSGAEVYWLRQPLSMNGKTYPVGTMYIPNTASVRPLLQQLAKEKGLNFEAASSKPTGAAAFKVQPMRIGMADVYGGSSNEGWTQWMLEQFEFPIQLVYPQEFEAGNLIAKYDVLIFEDGMLPAYNASTTCTPFDTTNYAPQYKAMAGSYRGKCISPSLTAFMNAGGVILTIGGSTRLGNYPDLDLKFVNAVSGLPRTDYYVPGSVLNAAIDNTQIVAWGMSDRVNLFVDSSPIFQFTAPDSRLTTISWFDTTTPLISGWAIGQDKLKGMEALLQAQIGDGALFLFGPDIDFRAQPQGAYKLIFNGIYYGGLMEVTL